MCLYEYANVYAFEITQVLIYTSMPLYAGPILCIYVMSKHTQACTLGSSIRTTRDREREYVHIIPCCMQFPPEKMFTRTYTCIYASLQKMFTRTYTCIYASLQKMFTRTYTCIYACLQKMFTRTRNVQKYMYICTYSCLHECLYISITSCLCPVCMRCSVAQNPTKACLQTRYVYVCMCMCGCEYLYMHEVCVCVCVYVYVHEVCTCVCAGVLHVHTMSIIK
jgi:hypothetical protein